MSARCSPQVIACATVMLVLVSQTAPAANCSTDWITIHPVEGAGRNAIRHFLDAHTPNAGCPGTIPQQWLHYGDDYGSIVGLAVLAVEEGVVIEARDREPDQWMNHIIIHHTDTDRYTGYWHLKHESIPPEFENRGDPVSQGARIGTTFVDHLHFELFCDPLLNNRNLIQPCLRQDPDRFPDVLGVAFRVEYVPGHACHPGPNPAIPFIYPDPIDPERWNYVHFCAYDAGVSGEGHWPGIIKARLKINGMKRDEFDLSEMGIRSMQEREAYSAIFNWQDQDCGNGRYYLSWEAGREGTTEDIRLDVWDCTGYLTSTEIPTWSESTGPVSVDRWVEEFRAQWGPNPEENGISWLAYEFDPGTIFVLKRSDDGGVNYADVAQVPFQPGDPFHEVFDPYTYHKKYVYRLWDSEGGGGAPGPDPWWDPPAVIVSRAGDAPPVPSTAPTIGVSKILGDGVEGLVTSGSEYADFYRVYCNGSPVDATVGDGQVLFAIGGLTAGTTYSLVARAFNDSGESPDGPAVLAVPLPPPGELYVVPGETLLNVSWSLVDGAVGYKLTYRHDSGTPTETIDVGDELNYAIRDLEPGFFCVSVGAYNEYGQTTDPSYLVCKAVGGPDAVAVEDGVSLVAPLGVVLRPAFPNPFNPSTTLRFSIPAQGRVKLTVWDILGRKRATLVEQGTVHPGQYEVRWDGRDDAGHDLAAGVYFVRLQWMTVTRQQKVVLIR